MIYKSFNKEQSMEIVLGQEYRDTITGFTGTATGKCEYYNGGTQIQLTPKLDKEGKLQKSGWFYPNDLTPFNR